MSYRQLSEFDKACIKGTFAGKTTRYLGDVTQAFKRGVITRQAPITNLMQTPQTWRTCRGCRGNKTVVIQNCNNLLTEQKCLICGGSGRVFN